jgi:peroxiredoxin
MRADVVPGARFPDYELTDTDEQPRRLSELQGNEPMILALSRGTSAPRSTAPPRARGLLPEGT